MITQKQNPLTKTIAVGVVALGLLAFAAPAHAGKREVNALNTALASVGKNVTNATAQELLDAVNAAATANPRYKVAVIVGEALRYGTDPNTGAFLSSLVPTGDVGFAGLAIKTAGTTKLANVENVPDFVAGIDEVDSEAEIFAVAKVAKASKTGVGAALQGYAAGNGITTDAALASLSNNAIGAKFTAAAQQIAQYVGQLAPNPEDYANTFAGSQANLAVKIATGATTSNPTAAGAIVSELMANATLVKLKTSQTVLLAKSVSAVADIEQITLIGSSLAAQIGSNAISVARTNVLVKTLAKAVAIRPLADSPFNTASNKQDEIAEIAAYFVNGIAGNPGITDKKAGVIVRNLIKNAVNGSKVTKKQAAAGPLTPLADIVRDVTASVVQTIVNAPGWDALEATVLAYLNDKAKTIAGKANEATVTAAIAAGSTGTNNSYEDGTIPANTVPDGLPESDFRPA